MSIAGLPFDLDLIVDSIWVKVCDPQQFYLECGDCGATSMCHEEMDLHEVIDWARGHHKHARVAL